MDQGSKVTVLAIPKLSTDPSAVTAPLQLLDG